MRKLLGVFMVLVLALGGIALAQEGPQRGGRGQGGPDRGPGMWGMMANTPERVLEQYDVDKDGALSKAEVEAWVKANNLRLYDTNRDGVIDEEEQARADERKARMEEMRKRFENGEFPRGQGQRGQGRQRRRPANNQN